MNVIYDTCYVDRDPAHAATFAAIYAARVADDAAYAREAAFAARFAKARAQAPEEKS